VSESERKEGIEATVESLQEAGFYSAATKLWQLHAALKIAADAMEAQGTLLPLHQQRLINEAIESLPSQSSRS
jgi:hypothetical protein